MGEKCPAKGGPSKIQSHRRRRAVIDSAGPATSIEGSSCSFGDGRRIIFILVSYQQKRGVHFSEKTTRTSCLCYECRRSISGKPNEAGTDFYSSNFPVVVHPLPFAFAICDDLLSQKSPRNRTRWKVTPPPLLCRPFLLLFYLLISIFLHSTKATESLLRETGLHIFPYYIEKITVLQILCSNLRLHNRRKFTPTNGLFELKADDKKTLKRSQANTGFVIWVP